MINNFRTSAPHLSISNSLAVTPVPPTGLYGRLKAMFASRTAKRVKQVVHAPLAELEELMEYHNPMLGVSGFKPSSEA